MSKYVFVIFQCVIAVALLALVLMSARIHRRPPRRAATLANLRAVGQSIIIFEQDHHRRPSSLEEIISKDNRDPRLFKSLYSDQQFEYINLPKSAPEGLIWAYDPTPIEQGVPGLLHGFSVMMLPQSDFNNLMDKTKKFMAEHSHLNSTNDIHE